ncbi:hypothetical protein CDEST_14097 [Colletotrichum destructivum]|uniref:Uncharacterized protein n=1 Tax=Colletotrichum destructivum TaxID=34406 RepID=A0AAX4J0J9_9PEZI|nr:hypothetical protein CDEST_14097 [Colletotrichum destructivum]
MSTARDEAKAKALTGGWASGQVCRMSGKRRSRHPSSPARRHRPSISISITPSRPNGNRGMRNNLQYHSKEQLCCNQLADCPNCAAVPGSLVAAPGVTYDQENGPEPQSSRLSLSLSLFLPLLHSLIRLENVIFQAYAGRGEDSTGTLPAWQPIQRPTACSRSEEDDGGPKGGMGDGRRAVPGEGGYGTRSASSTPI